MIEWGSKVRGFRWCSRSGEGVRIRKRIISKWNELRGITIVRYNDTVGPSNAFRSTTVP